MKEYKCSASVTIHVDTLFIDDGTDECDQAREAIKDLFPPEIADDCEVFITEISENE
jgi:hypothetical protein